MRPAADGQRAFGENYIAEGVTKIVAMRNLQMMPIEWPLEWHCIGPVQSNKTRLVAEHFDWVQSVDRLKIAQRSETVVQLPEAWAVSPTDDLMARLERLFGDRVATLG